MQLHDMVTVYINSISGATAAKSYEGNYSEDYDS